MCDRNEPRELELSGAEMRRLVAAAMDRIAAHVDSLPDQPAADEDLEAGRALAASLRQGAPEAGRPFEEILGQLFDDLVPRSFNAAGPGYLAYIPGGGLLQSAVADLIADSVNRYTGVFAAAPGLGQLEINVVRWLCAAVGLPNGSFGFLTSGGSMATLSAVVTARHERLGEDFSRGVVYVSNQVHHCVTRAARIAGLPAANVRVIEADGRLRLPVERLRQAIAEDRRSGLVPFLLVGSAGTVNTGAVDPLPELADLAAAEDLWFHIDAAYGGFFVLTDRGKRRLAGIERADSVVLDPHKGLFLPYGTGALLVRDGMALHRAHSQDADYLPPLQRGMECVDFCEISPELSKPYRGLRVWLPIQMHGLGAFRAALDEKLDLARWLADEIETMEGLELVAPPVLSLLAFRVRSTGRSAEELDGLTRRLHRAVNDRQRVHLTATRVDGRYTLRVCVLSFRTHRDRLEMALADLRAGLAEVLADA